MVSQAWMEAHFVGGHPVLDLANTVYDPAHPAEHNELLTTPADVLAWCVAAGLLEDGPAKAP
ncbi:MAG: ABATE domain-containing protein, partial [Actinomycetes bacterium]